MIDRRRFLKFTAAAAGTSLLSTGEAFAEQPESLQKGGKDFAQYSGTELQAIPSICGQCPSRCAILGYLDEGRLVKIEGHPNSIRNQGRVCAKGQSGVSKVYDPDRILTPLKRSGKRGQGKWQRISWDEALNELASRLKRLRDEGTPERFIFHHGWIPASAEQLIDEIFLPAYGSASIIRQTCHSQSARWTAHELTWGANIDSWDIDNSGFVLNFGSNLLEADTNFVSLAQRLATSTVDNRLKMVTFDVRLSNTAAKSDLWLPIKPGSDLAVVLAMCNVIMSEGLFEGAGEAFLDFCRVSKDVNASRSDKIAALKAHLAEYSPEWAEKISGVAASQIQGVAHEFSGARQACVISSRGTSAHFNGVDTERAIQMLCAITGNIDAPGGRCRAVTPEWRFPQGPKRPPQPRRLSFIDNDAALVEFGAGHSVLERIMRSGDRPGVYMWYHHNPAYSNADMQKTLEILKDESLLPYTVAVTPFYDETAALADLILPDATYLERYDVESGVSPGQVPEYALRQPLVTPQGESRDFKDVCLELADRLEMPLGFKSAEKYIKKVCKLTPLVKKKARGLRGMKKRGVWHDKKAAPLYHAYRNRVPDDALATDGVILDQPSGVYWNWKTAGIASEEQAATTGYLNSPGASRGYIGQRINGQAYTGFKPGRLNKSGLFEIYSPILAARGLSPLPTYTRIPGHSRMQQDELILTTFKVNVQTLSNTGNCSWLAEIHHENPAWINPVTATARGIVDGDIINIRSQTGMVTATAMVTATIVPGVIAVPAHLGRTQGGRYAADKRAPFAVDDAHHDEHKWWRADGTHVNGLIPSNPEPVSGQQSWMDTVVTVSKAR